MSKAKQYSPPRLPSSPFLTQPLPTAVPSLDELLALQQELKALHDASVARSQKSEKDIEEWGRLWQMAKALRKHHLNEKKGKGKARPPKVKREESGTPAAEESTPSNFYPPRPQPVHRSEEPATIVIPFKKDKDALRPSNDPKKKKRKRDRPDESGDEASMGRASPLPPIPVPKKVKHLPVVNGAGHEPTVSPSIATDFTLPHATVSSIMPQKSPTGLGVWGPIIEDTSNRGPKKVTDVNEDFVHAKAPPNQLQVGTFWKEVESWTKGVGEEDVAWLGYDEEDVDPYLIPPLGRHYTEAWEIEDSQATTSRDQYHHGSTSNSHPPRQELVSGQSEIIPILGGSGPPAGHWDSSNLAEPDLVTEKKSLGPITERLLSALLEVPPQTPTGPVTNGIEDDSMDVEPAASSSKANAPSGSELENRLRSELKAVGLMGDENQDPSQPVDDEISTALRQAQSLLRKQFAINTARKERLLLVAKDRLAYAEYLSYLDNLNKLVTAGAQRIQRAAKGASKKRKSGHSDNDGSSAGGSGKKGVVWEVPPSLLEKVELRRRFKDQIGKAMDDWEMREPGRLYSLPEKSVFEGIETEVGLANGVATSPETSKSLKGKGVESSNGG